MLFGGDGHTTAASLDNERTVKMDSDLSRLVWLFVLLLLLLSEGKNVREGLCSHRTVCESILQSFRSTTVLEGERDGYCFHTSL